VNPARRERVLDGIETRTSPQPAWVRKRGRRLVKPCRDRSVTGTRDECRAAHGGQPVSKSGEQRSIRWLGAKGASSNLPRRSACTRKIRVEIPACPLLLSSDGSERCLVCRAFGFDFRRELFARGGAPRPRRRKSSTRHRFGKEGLPNAQGGRVSAAAKSNLFARMMFNGSMPIPRARTNDEQHWRAARAANARRVGSFPALVSRKNERSSP
jgi:hypothetical protein